MRIGVNPQKLDFKVPKVKFHRVIIVVYIPGDSDYYSNYYDVFKLCVDSLHSSISDNCAVTIVNNGSCSRVRTLLDIYYSKGIIDCLIHHQTNIGKIDALIGAARASRESIITLSDSDILFVKGWQEEVEKIFMCFDEAGAVSPIPVRTGIMYATSYTLLNILLGKLKFKYQTIPENFENYNKYLVSINWDKESNPNLLWPVIEKNKLKAIVGSGHQIISIKRDILLKAVPSKPSFIKVGQLSEYQYVDIPVDLSGSWRLATYHNFAFHMGNKLEDWMIEIAKFNSNIPSSNSSFEFDFNKEVLSNKYSMKFYLVKKRIFKFLFKLFFN